MRVTPVGAVHHPHRKSRRCQPSPTENLLDREGIALVPLSNSTAAKVAWLAPVRLTRSASSPSAIVRPACARTENPLGDSATPKPLSVARSLKPHLRVDFRFLDQGPHLGRAAQPFRTAICEGVTWIGLAFPRSLGQPSWWSLGLSEALVNRIGAAAIIAATAVAWTAVPSAEAAQSQVQIRAATINVCGVNCNHGKVFKTVGLVVQIATKQKLDVIGVQEMCWKQYRGVRKKLAPSGYEARFVTTRFSRTCGPPGTAARRFGNAIFVRADRVAGVIRIKLPNPAHTEPRRLLCVTALIRQAKIRTCVTHLDGFAVGNYVQTKFISGYLKSQVSKYRYVIFTGDVNFRQRDDRQRQLEALLDGTGPRNSIDRVMEKGGTTISRFAFSDVRTDHRIYVAVFRFS